MHRFNHWIDGKDSPAAPGSRVFEKFSPEDGSLAALVPEAGPAEVDAAVQSARHALRAGWSRTSAGERGVQLRRIAAGIRERFDEFVAAECADTGKPASLARHLDVPRASANFEAFADLHNNLPTDAFEMPTRDGGTAISLGQRIPRGVVGVISPWNLPLLLLTWKVAPALACGNAVVVKPSELSPTSANLLGEVIAAAGVPAGVYNVVHGFGAASTGQLLAEHPDVNAITVTGSTRTGEAVMRAASAATRPVSLELGGKNSAIVFADCDLDAAVAGCMRSAFENCGQVCLGTERIYVHRRIIDSFVERLEKGARGLRPARAYDDVATLGPLISAAHRAKVLSYFERAVRDGARVVTGGGVPDMPAALARGAWVEPTIWLDLPDSSPVNHDEIFGPCCNVRAFDDEAEAIGLANDTAYGLAASIWTQDASRGYRVARQIDTGLVWINSWFLRDLRTAFGGMKRSGIGREGGVHSIDFYSQIKNITLQYGAGPRTT